MSDSPTRLLSRALVLGILGIFLWLAPVGAETPTEVVEQTAVDGVYIARGVDPIDETLLIPVVERAQREGIEMVIIAPRDPQPDPEAFALRVRQAAEADVALSLGPEGGIYASVVEDYEDGIIRALNAAEAETNPGAAADVFLTELTTEPDRPLPEVIRTVVKVVIYLVVLLLLAAIAEQLFRRWRRKGRVAAGS